MYALPIAQCRTARPLRAKERRPCMQALSVNRGTSNASSVQLVLPLY